VKQLLVLTVVDAPLTSAKAVAPMKGTMFVVVEVVVGAPERLTESEYPISNGFAMGPLIAKLSVAEGPISIIWPFRLRVPSISNVAASHVPESKPKNEIAVAARSDLRPDIGILQTCTPPAHSLSSLNCGGNCSQSRLVRKSAVSL
jgi:hypothetical protein